MAVGLLAPVRHAVEDARREPRVAVERARALRRVVDERGLREDATGSAGRRGDGALNDARREQPTTLVVGWVCGGGVRGIVSRDRARRATECRAVAPSPTARAREKHRTSDVSFPP